MNNSYPKYIVKDEKHLFITFAEGCEPEYSGSLTPRHGLPPICSEEEDNLIDLSKKEFMVLCAKPAKKKDEKMALDKAKRIRTVKQITAYTIHKRNKFTSYSDWHNEGYEHDVSIDVFLACCPQFKLVGSIINGKAKWMDGFKKDQCGALYVQVVNGHIIKSGLTETSICQRQQSVETGKAKYGGNANKAGTNSSTNRKTLQFQEQANADEKSCDWYAWYPDKLHAEEHNIFNELVETEPNSLKRHERNLHFAIMAMSNNYQPILNTQVPEGRSARYEEDENIYQKISGIKNTF